MSISCKYANTKVSFLLAIWYHSLCTLQILINGTGMSLWCGQCPIPILLWFKHSTRIIVHQWSILCFICELHHFKCSVYHNLHRKVFVALIWWFRHRRRNFKVKYYRKEEECDNRVYECCKPKCKIFWKEENLVELWMDSARGKMHKSCENKGWQCSITDTTSHPRSLLCNTNLCMQKSEPSNKLILH